MEQSDKKATTSVGDSVESPATASSTVEPAAEPSSDALSQTVSDSIPSTNAVAVTQSSVDVSAAAPESAADASTTTQPETISSSVVAVAAVASDTVSVRVDSQTTSTSAAPATIVPSRRVDQVDEPSSSTSTPDDDTINTTPAVDGANCESTSNSRPVSVVAEAPPEAAASAARLAVVESCRTHRTDDRVPTMPVAAADPASKPSSNSSTTTIPTAAVDAASAGSSAVVNATCDSSAIVGAAVVAGTAASSASAAAAESPSNGPAAAQRVSVVLNNVTATADSSSSVDEPMSTVAVAAVISSSDNEKQTNAAKELAALEAEKAAQAAQDLAEEETARFWRNHQFKGDRLRGGLSSSSSAAAVTKPATACSVTASAPTIVFESSAPRVQPLINRQATTNTTSELTTKSENTVASTADSITSTAIAAAGALVPGNAKTVQYIAVKQPERPASVSSDDGSVSDLVIDETPRDDVVEERLKNDSSSRVADDGGESSAKRLYDRHNGTSSKENGVANEHRTHSSWMQPQQQLLINARLQPPPLVISSAPPDATAASKIPAANMPAQHRKHSLYVQNPDFSKHSSNHINSSKSSGTSANDLSSLHMKPPDFSKIYSTNIDSKSTGGQPDQTAAPGIHPGNFAEISKQRNYISDLQLKTPSPPKHIQTTIPSPPIGMLQPQSQPQLVAPTTSAANSRSYNYPLIKAPDFTKPAKNFAPVPLSALADDQPAPNNHKTPAVPAPPAIHTNPTPEAIPAPAIVYKTFPQISQDVTMSIVPNQQPPPQPNPSHQQQLSHPPHLQPASSHEAGFPPLSSSSRPPYVPYMIGGSGPSTVSSQPPPLKHHAPYSPYTDQHILPPRKNDSYRNPSMLEMTSAYGNRIPDPYAGREQSPHHAPMHYQPPNHLSTAPGSFATSSNPPPQGQLSLAAANDLRHSAQSHQPAKHPPSSSASSLPTTSTATSSAHPPSRPFAHNMPENYVKQNSSYIPRNEDPGTYYETSTSKPHPLPGPTGHPHQQQQPPPLQQHSSALHRSQAYPVVQPFQQPHPTHPMHMQSHQSFQPPNATYGPLPPTMSALGPTEHKSRSRTKPQLPPAAASVASVSPGPMNPPLSWHGPVRISQSPVSQSAPTSNIAPNLGSGSSSSNSSYGSTANNNSRVSRSPHGVHTTSPHYPLHQGFDPTINTNPATSAYQSYSSIPSPNGSAPKHMSHAPPMLSSFNQISSPFGHPSMAQPPQSNAIQPPNTQFYPLPESQYRGQPDYATKQPLGNSKQVEFVDLTKSAIPSQRQSSATIGPSTMKAGNSRDGAASNRNDKPAYANNTNTIMDPFVYRHSSEDALNYEIIKKTLNKDARRVDHDMGRKNMPGPSSQYKSSIGAGAASTSSAGYSHIPSRVQQPSQQQHHPSQQPLQHPPTHPQTQQPPMQPPPMPAELNHRHELTVIPSRSLVPSVDSVLRAAPNNDASFHPSQTSTQNYQYYPLSNSAGAPQVKQEPNSGSVASVPMPPQPPLQPTTSRQSHDAAAALQSRPNIRRDAHPLDLSVKTVKTKADSTICENYATSSSASPSPLMAGRSAGVCTPPAVQARPFGMISQPPSLKVEFAPNFYAHSDPSPGQRILPVDQQQQRANHSTAPMSNHIASSGQQGNMIAQTHSATHRPLSVPTSIASAPLGPPPVSRGHYLQPQQQEQFQQQQLQARQLMQSYSPAEQYQAMYVHPPQPHPSQQAIPKQPQLQPPPESAPFESLPAAKERKPTSRTSKAGPSRSKTSTPPVKSFVHNPSVPTVFGAKPEELKNLPVIEPVHNSGVLRNTATATITTAYSPYGNRADASPSNANINQHPAVIRRPNDHLRYLQSDPNARPAGHDQQPSGMPAPALQSAPPPLAQLSQRRTDPPSNAITAPQLYSRVPPMTSHGQFYANNSHPGAQPAPYSGVAAIQTPSLPPATTLQPSQQLQSDPKRMASAPFESHTEAKRERKESPMPPISSQYPNHNAAYRAESMVLQQKQQQQRNHHNSMPPYEDSHRGAMLHGPNDAYTPHPHNTRLDESGQGRPLHDTKLLPPPPMHDVKPHNNRQYYPAPTQQTWYPPAAEQWPPPVAGRIASSTATATALQLGHQPELVVQQRAPAIVANHRAQTVQLQPMQPLASVSLATHPPAGLSSVGPSTAPLVYRGADKGVITKLRTNLELKEQQKLRHSSNSTGGTSGTGLDLCNSSGTTSNGPNADTADQKSDMASLIAARIRTKGELKGFTPIPVPSVVSTVTAIVAAETAVEASVKHEPKTAAVSVVQPMPSTSAAAIKEVDTFEDRLKAEFAEFSTVSLNVELNEYPSRDLMNWGSACDGFQHQLQTGATSTAATGSGSTSSTMSPTKKPRSRASRGGRRQSANRMFASGDDDVHGAIKSVELPGSDYKCDIDPEILVDVIAGERKLAETTTPAAAAASSVSKTQRSSDSSSDEDTPLGVLRQQSLNEAKIRSEVEGMCKVMPPVVAPDAIDQLEPVSKEHQVRVKKEQQRVKREQEKKLTIASSSSDEDAPSPTSPQQRGQRAKKMLRKPRQTKASKTVKSEADGHRHEESSGEQSTDVGTEQSKTNKRTKLQMKDDASSDNSEPAVVRRKVSKLESDSKATSEDEQPSKSEAAVKVPEIRKRSADVANESEDSSDDSDEADDSKSRSRKIPVIQETMTRSKRKLEEEQLKANSKILRNEKVIKNVITAAEKKEKSPLKSLRQLNRCKDEAPDKSAATPPARRGSARKAPPTVGSDSEVSGDESQPSSRLRSRLSKSISESTPTTPAADRASGKANSTATADKPTNKKASKSSARQNSIGTTSATNSKDVVKPSAVDKPNSYPIGWEQQAYEFKRSLKIPASLITIGRPGSNQHKPSSLPDLDPQHSSDTSELFSEHKRRLLESLATAAALAAITDPKKEPINRRGRPAKLKADPDAKTLPPSPDGVEDSATTASPSKSIIDLLHQRVIRPASFFKPVRSKFRAFNNEPKILPQSNVAELLPTPGADGDCVFSKSLNVFETPVLKSRTRKGHLVQQSQDILRNVFGCADSDRPASAPPMNFDTASTTAAAITVKREPSAEDAANASDGCAEDGRTLTSMYTTFDQKYQQYLQKMNFDIGEKIRKQRPGAVVSTPTATMATTSTHAANTSPLLQSIKLEQMDVDDDADESQDTLLSECMRIKEEGADEDDDMDDDGEAASDRGTPSVMSAMSAEERDGHTPGSTAFRASGGGGGVGGSSSKSKSAGRSHRPGRRKGSSGFDYIRKKKKPLVNADGTPGAQPKVPRRAAAINYLEVKNESDISREIRGWVLQKGLGESVLHKAARLGYMDVIAYCVERLDMSPNQKDNAGYTPLHEACSRGSLDIAKLLLRYGANHSDTAHAGKRPLHEAVENGFVEIVRLLLAYGADPLLATYGGQTPIMLAEDNDEMIQFLKAYQQDIQYTGPNTKPWRFDGAWHTSDPDECGFDIFAEVPDDCGDHVEGVPTATTTPRRRADKRDSNANNILMSPNLMRPAPANPNNRYMNSVTAVYKSLSSCTVLIESLAEQKAAEGVARSGEPVADQTTKPCAATAMNSDSEDGICDDDSDDGELFEFEEAEAPHVPLYSLRDEGSVKWAMLTDLCVMLKVKSKDTLLKQICSSSPPSIEQQRDMLRELKMDEFLQRSSCHQLLCAGEKLNINSSKVVLVKYTDSVKRALGVKTTFMRM